MAEVDDGDAGIRSGTAEIIARLGDRLNEVTAAVQQEIVTGIAELRGDPQLLQLQRDSVEGNIDTIFSAIQHEIPIEQVVPPTAALEYARRLAQHGIEPNALLRAYRLGQQRLMEIVLHEIQAVDLEREVSLDFVVHVTNITFGYIDWISQRVVEAYQTERDRWLENRNSLRTMRVRELLEAGDVDIDAATTGKSPGVVWFRAWD